MLPLISLSNCNYESFFFRLEIKFHRKLNVSYCFICVVVIIFVVSCNLIRRG